MAGPARDTTHERTLETIVTAATIQGWIRIGIMIDIDAVKADISSCGGHSEWRKVRAKTPMVMRIDSRRGIPAAIKDIAAVLETRIVAEKQKHHSNEKDCS